MSKEREKIIIVLGTTASGKTALGVRLARDFGCEIISADSRQVYRGMDLGTGKDLKEYGAVPYHLIDVVDPDEAYSLAQWLEEAHKAIADISRRGRVPMVVGGTALYLNALINNYQLEPEKADAGLRQKLNAMSLDELAAELRRLDPEAAERVDLKNPRRVTRALEKILGGSGIGSEDKAADAKYEFLILGLTYPRPELRQRISERLQTRLEAGMEAEVAELHKKRGVSWQKLDDFGLEYRFISRYLRGKLSREEMEEKLAIAIGQFAKRQMTWFKKMPEIYWVKDYKEAERSVRAFLRAD